LLAVWYRIKESRHWP